MHPWNKRQARSLSIRGVEYSSISQAAKKMHVTRETIRRAMENGTLDQVGVYEGPKSSKPVRVGGVTYPSITEASKKLKMSRRRLMELNEFEE